ncbi:hypothetical protein F0562_011292 [Nyssa sinensis]|uniref:Association with the SNF1 complex (ASC) domain-containing protein n=1 Tax=Nyssa sinensis TaxID=561372 RepID=A0A5J5A3I6_9ASTE|nr:hypothetical protein F0562_011292 [Nyssa sinensis]
MGNVSGKKDEAGPSGTENEESEEYMEYAHGGAHVSYHAHGPFPESMVQSPPHPHSPRAYPSPLMFTQQVPMVPLRRPDEMMHTPSNEPTQNTTEYEDMLSEKGIPTMITWNYDGKQVAVEGSWDNWKTREFLHRSGNDFSIVKVLQSGVYNYRFIVDGQWRYAPDLPHERDDRGNMFNILDLQDYIPEVPNNISASESPASPISDYNNSPFHSEDFNEKLLPEMPPLLQKTPLDQPSSSKDIPESLDKPLAAVLNHLYIQKGRSGESMVALSSTHRFRSKYVTVVLYKSLSKVKD